jgi:hypothetical protein
MIFKKWVIIILILRRVFLLFASRLSAKYEIKNNKIYKGIEILIVIYYLCAFYSTIVLMIIF